MVTFRVKFCSTNIKISLYINFCKFFFLIRMRYSCSFDSILPFGSKFARIWSVFSYFFSLAFSESSFTSTRLWGGLFLLKLMSIPRSIGWSYGLLMKSVPNLSSGMLLCCSIRRCLFIVLLGYWGENVGEQGGFE